VPYYMGVRYGFFKMATGNFEWDEVFRFSLVIIKSFFSEEFTFFFVRLVFVINVSLFTSVASATVKMDNGENMENARYAMNDDTAGFINQMKTQVGKLSIIWN